MRMIFHTTMTSVTFKSDRKFKKYVESLERDQKRASKKVKIRNDALQLKEIKPFSLQEEN